MRSEELKTKRTLLTLWHDLWTLEWDKMRSSALSATASAANGGWKRSCLLNSTFISKFPSIQLHHAHSHHKFFFRLRVRNEETGETKVPLGTDKSEADKIVDGMDFGELCNDFECISSPLVESTARQLLRDILELREGNRALGTYAVSVKYKDPVRSFTGRDKYKRPLWITGALEKPSVSVQEMVMLSTSVLSIEWTIKGIPKSIIGSIGGDVIIRVTSRFTLNQISGQVIEHEELWDLSTSSPIAQLFFWTSRRLFAAVETGKDLYEDVKGLTRRLSPQKENSDYYPDPSGDPTKFFQRDDGFQQDLYQIALLLAVLYFVVQYLRTTL